MRSKNDSKQNETLLLGVAQKAGRRTLDCHDKGSPTSVECLVPSSQPPGFGSAPFSVRQRITMRGLHSSGGIGEVWIAYDKVLGREIALKRLRAEQGEIESHRARFTREAKITARLEHPGIVPVYDFHSNEDGTQCYYTMRFLHGSTLRDVVAAFHTKRRDSSGPLVSAGFLQLLRNFVTVCNTMEFAHSRGIIHRDLKGENIMVGDFGEVVVLDWGLAKYLADDESELADSSEDIHSSSPGATLQGQRLGTPGYMAPEQASGRIDLIDCRTDVYGLAAVLYEILTGQPPFRGTEVREILQSVEKELPVAPRSLVAGIPPQLERVCLQGLSKERADRQQSVAELSLSIDSWLSALAEKKRTEQERERFFNLSTDLLALVDREGVLIQSNAAWQSSLGWDEGSREATTLDSFVLELDRPLALEKLQRLWAEQELEKCELRMRTADGGYRWVEWNLQLVPGEPSVYLVGRDVTERKQLESDFEGLLESAPDATCVIDEKKKIVLVNAQLEKMFGYNREQLLGRSVEILVPEHLRDRHEGHVSRFVAAPCSRTMGSGLNLMGQKADGTVFAVEVSLSPVETERRLLISCTLRDVRDRRREERRVMAILEAAPDAMLVADESRRICYVNRRTEELFGYERSELIGQPIEMLMPARFREAHPDHVAGYASNPVPRTMGAGRVLFGCHRDGSEFPLEISLSSVATEDGLMISSAIRPTK